MTVAYDVPGLSDEPRFVVPITFMYELPGTTIEKTRLDLSAAFRKIADFLTGYIEEPTRLPFFSIQASLDHPPDHIVLRDPRGRGRFGSVYRVVQNPESQHPPLVSKVFSYRQMASVVRETLFYEAVFASLKTPLPVPKFYGTYVSVGNGWYVMLPEDVGTPVEGFGDMFPPYDERLAKSVRKPEQAFEKAGIEHGDIRPSNVLRSTDDGSLRLVDFGFSQLIA